MKAYIFFKKFLISSLVLIFCSLQAIAKDNEIPKRVVVLGHDIANIMYELSLDKYVICAPSGSIFKNIQSIGPYHAPNAELIIKCKPDLIISTYSGTPPYIHDKLSALNYKIINYKPVSIESIKSFIITLASIFKIDPKNSISKFENLCVKTATKKAVIIIGLNPIYAVGSETFVSDAIKCAGFFNPISGSYPRISLEKIIKINPDYLISSVIEAHKFSDFKRLNELFKDRILFINSDIILQASPAIIDGIKELKKY